MKEKLELSQNELFLIQKYAIKEKVVNPKVSIIIPAYNAEKYIFKCLISLIQQSLTDIEIIVVNDGSTDNTTDMVDLFSSKDSRIKLINQPNLKQGAARNNGIKNATGEYLGFVDADDWVDLDYYEKLYLAAKKYNSDIALGTNVRIGNGKTKKRLNIEREDLLTTLQSKIDICNLYKDACPTNKIYRTDFLRTNEILYPEGVYCEDKIFSTKAVYYANGIVTVPNIFYYYFRNPTSTVNSNAKSHKKKKIRDRDDARRTVLEFLKSKNVEIRDKDFWAVKKDFKLFGLSIYTIKESIHTEKHLLLSAIPIYERSTILYN